MRTKCQNNTLSKWNDIPLANIDNSIRRVCQNCADVRHFYECFAANMRKPFTTPILHNNNAFNAFLRQRLHQQQCGNYFVRMAQGTTCNPQYLQYFFTKPENTKTDDCLERSVCHKHRIPLVVNTKYILDNQPTQNRMASEHGDDRHGANGAYPTSDSLEFMQFPDVIRKPSRFPKSWFRDLYSLYWKIGAEYDIDPNTKQFRPRFKNNMTDFPDFLQNVLTYGFSEQWLNDLYEQFMNLDDEAAAEWLNRVREIGDNHLLQMQNEDAKCCDGVFCGYCQPIADKTDFSRYPKRNLTHRPSMLKSSRSGVHSSRHSVAWNLRNKMDRKARNVQKPQESLFQIPFHRPFDRNDRTTFMYTDGRPVMAVPETTNEKPKVTISEPQSSQNRPPVKKPKLTK